MHTELSGEVLGFHTEGPRFSSRPHTNTHEFTDRTKTVKETPKGETQRKPNLGNHYVCWWRNVCMQGYFTLISSGTVNRVERENAGRKAPKYIHNKNTSMVACLK